MLSAVWIVVARPALAQTETVLYCFGSQSGDGLGPVAGLVFDTAGNLYGTTIGGGVHSHGTVFELTAANAEQVLDSFGVEADADGSEPDAGLVFDTDGNLYGTTIFGGISGGGTVFEITSAGTEDVLYSFQAHGFWPEAVLVMDKKRNLYSSTFAGGASGHGTVFRIDPKNKEAVLYSFCSQLDCTDGTNPTAGLVFDKKGYLYGTTSSGGAYSGGTVFKTKGHTEIVLYSFGSRSGDGSYPAAVLVLDKDGNIYGTTKEGGAYGGGTVFEITSAGAEKILYSFGSQSGDGLEPVAGLVFDTAGNLYGTTFEGGVYGYGTVFELTFAGTEKVLHSFTGPPGDGHYPTAGLVFDRTGNLYGTTNGGGLYSEGIVFEVTP